MRRLAFLCLPFIGFALPVSAGNAPSAGLRLATLDGRGWINPGDDGRISVIAFWDSACAPCLVELQSLPALARANPNVRFIAAGLESRSIQRRTLSRFGVTGIELAQATPAHIQRLGNAKGALPFATSHQTSGEVCGRTLGALTPVSLSRAVAGCAAR